LLDSFLGLLDLLLWSYWSKVLDALVLIAQYLLFYDSLRLTVGLLEAFPICNLRNHLNIRAETVVHLVNAVIVDPRTTMYALSEGSTCFTDAALAYKALLEAEE
jgi:hypothetical protein